MPIRESVDTLVRLVGEGAFVDAIERFYAEDAATREPAQPPVVGKAALVAKERGFLARVAEWHDHRALDVLVDGECAAIHWRMELTLASGQRMTLEEIALQRWSGEGIDARIVSEQYFPFAKPAPP